MKRDLARMKFMKRAMGAMDKPRLMLQGTPNYDKDLINEININETHPQWIDVVYAQNHDNNTPTCVMIHGGGLFYGDKSLNLSASVEMAKRGFNVINVDYPLIDEVSCIEQIQAILNVCEWIEQHHTQYQLNHEHVFMMGDSAGAYLSLVTSIITRQPDFLKLFQTQLTIKIKAIGLICIMARLTRSDSLSFIQHLALKNPVHPELKAILCDPLAYIEYAPPCFVMGCEEDFLVQDTLDTIQACQTSHHRYESLFFDKGKYRPLLHVFPITFPKLEESQKTFNECAHFFHAYLHLYL